MKKGKRILTETDRQGELIRRQQAIVKSFGKNLNKLNRIDESLEDGEEYWPREEIPDEDASIKLINGELQLYIDGVESNLKWYIHNSTKNEIGYEYGDAAEFYKVTNPKDGEVIDIFVINPENKSTHPMFDGAPDMNEIEVSPDFDDEIEIPRIYVTQEGDSINVEFESEISLTVSNSIGDKTLNDIGMMVKEGMHEIMSKISDSLNKPKMRQVAEGKGSNNDTYFETLSATLEYVRGAVQNMGYELDEEQLNFQFGSGGISYGQTKSANISLLQNGQEILGKSGKPLNRAVSITIYRMDSGKYELTMYKTF